jgi:thioester reductase-like protein
MFEDAVLPPDVRPFGRPETRRRVALLTGATGFLGRYAARALLLATELRLVCLVRGNDDADARQRLLAALARTGVSAPEHLDRLDVVCGDVAEPNFGLDRARIDALTAQVDSIYHCAAEVNWARSYRQLRAVNVLGTLEMLRFACAGRPKPLAFVSTIAVCFAHGDNEVVDEDSDMLSRVEAMPLGYAQSKCVAESLLRQASARGLPVTILRPALIAGDSRTGDVNPDDVMAALVQGCSVARAAIDVDWLFDCVPVDFVADVLARVPPPSSRHPLVLHLVHDQARHWREVVLWMNLRGYPVKLLPTAAWLDHAFARGHTAGTRLYGYRRFFQGYGEGQRPFEAYLEPEQRRVRAHHTRHVLDALGVATPPLDAALLHRYFERYRELGLLPSSSAHSGAGHDATMVASDFEALLRRRARANAIRVIAVRPAPFTSENGILNEISSVRLGARVGIRRFVVDVERQGLGAPFRLDTLVKTKATDEILETLTVELAATCDEHLGKMFERHRDKLGLSGSRERELALYELRDPRLRRYTPRCLGTVRRSPGDLHTLVLENVPEVDTRDVSAALETWDAARIAAVVRGLASIQSVGIDAGAWCASTRPLAQERTVDEMIAMSPLWHSLIEYASTWFGQWCPAFPALQHRLVATVDDWWPAVETLPRALIHNDFNPRNVALRTTRKGLRLCAFDWELAAFGLPQRDLAEFLCFAARGEGSPDPALVEAHVEQHRVALAKSAGTTLDQSEWRAGFLLALRQFVVTRLPMYALVHRFRPQRFLPHVVRNAAHLNDVAEKWCTWRGSAPARPRSRVAAERVAC